MALHPVVLCGGSGQRLWPASRPGRPKQFLSLTGARSSFQETLIRLAPMDAARPIVVTGPAMSGDVLAQAAQIGARPIVLVEPQARNSGPAAAAAAAYVLERDPEGVVLLLAADHSIGEPDAFREAAQVAARAAGRGLIVTFGVKPDRPATGYGYIKPGEPLGHGVRAVEAFNEKPDAQTAARYLAEGRLWNSGAFAFRADVLLEEMAAFEPQMAQAAAEAVRAASVEGDVVRLDADAFARASAKSLDYAVMERTKKAAVVPAAFAWSDLGSWSSVLEVSDRDDRGNAVTGKVALRDVANSIVRTDGPLVAAIGVEGLAIIVDGDAVLVCPLDRAEEVKAIVETLKAGGG